MTSIETMPVTQAHKLIQPRFLFIGCKLRIIESAQWSLQSCAPHNCLREALRGRSRSHFLRNEFLHRHLQSSILLCLWLRKRLFPNDQRRAIRKLLQRRYKRYAMRRCCHEQWRAIILRKRVSDCKRATLQLRTTPTETTPHLLKPHS